MDRAKDLVFTLPVCAHVLETLTVALDSTEIFVQPNNDVAFGGALSKALEPEQRIEERLATCDDGVHVESLAGPHQDIDGAIFENVAPKRNERRRAVVHDERCVFCEERLHQRIESSLINTSFPQEFESVHVQSLVLEERPIDRVCIDATNRLAPGIEVLGKNARDQRFP